MESGAPPRASLVWVDVDAGLDDAQGLLLLVAWLKDHPHATLAGISCVSGNVGVQQVALNVRKVLQLARAEERIPLYLGSSRPLVQPLAPPTCYFGSDGLGDVDMESLHLEPFDNEKFVPRNGHASVHLVACAREHKNSLTVIATGPLTNIALACRLDDEFPQLVDRVCIMGGSVDSKANPEFNFSLDPEAAHICLDSFPLVTLVTWECGIANALSWDWFYQWLAASSPQAVFMMTACRDSAASAEADGYSGYVTCDALAFAVCLNPALISSASQVKGEVLISSDKGASGRLVTSKPLDGKANVVLVEKVEMAGLLRLLTAAFGGS